MLTRPKWNPPIWFSFGPSPNPTDPPQGPAIANRRILTPTVSSYFASRSFDTVIILTLDQLCGSEWIRIASHLGSRKGSLGMTVRGNDWNSRDEEDFGCLIPGVVECTIGPIPTCLRWPGRWWDELPIVFLPFVSFRAFLALINGHCWVNLVPICCHFSY